MQHEQRSSNIALGLKLLKTNLISRKINNYGDSTLTLAINLSSQLIAFLSEIEKKGNHRKKMEHRLLAEQMIC